MVDKWYYKSRGEVHGPLPFDGIREKGRSGEISPDDLIRLGSEGEWVSVESVSPLSAVLKMAGPAQPRDSSDPDAELEEYRDLSELDLAPTEWSVDGKPGEGSEFVCRFPAERVVVAPPVALS